MKALKKLTMILLALGMTVSFAACDLLGGKNEESTSETSQTSEVVEKKGEELSEAEFNAAVQALYNQTNVEVTITDGASDPNGTTQSITGKVCLADEKMYMEMSYTSDGVTTTSKSYVGEVDGKCYQWTLKNNTFWDYFEMPNETAASNFKGFLTYVFKWCNFTYYSFNAKDGVMEFPNFGEATVNVKVVDGEIVGFRFEDKDGSWYMATITCGNAVVGELPSFED